MTGEEGEEDEEAKMEKIFQQYRSLLGFKQNQSKQSMAKGDFIRLLSCASSKGIQHMHPREILPNRHLTSTRLFCSVNLTFLKDIEPPEQDLLPTEEKEKEANEEEAGAVR